MVTSRGNFMSKSGNFAWDWTPESDLPLDRVHELLPSRYKRFVPQGFSSNNDGVHPPNENPLIPGREGKVVPSPGEGDKEHNTEDRQRNSGEKPHITEDNQPDSNPSNSDEFVNICERGIFGKYIAENSGADSCEKVSKAKMGSLKKINLYHKQISNIPEGAFEGLTSLEVIELSWNLITNISANTFKGLTSLKEINLKDNQIFLRVGCILYFNRISWKITVKFFSPF